MRASSSRRPRSTTSPARRRGALDDGEVWVIDPLDGTTSFVHGYPSYSVSVALRARTAQPVAGAVYNAALDEMNCGRRRARAPLATACRLTVSAAPRRSETRCSITGFPYDRGAPLDRQLAVLSGVPARAGPRHPPRRLGGHRLLPRGRGARRRLLGVLRSSRGTWRPASSSAERPARSSPTSTARRGRPHSESICAANPDAARARCSALIRAAQPQHPAPGLRTALARRD